MRPCADRTEGYTNGWWEKLKSPERVQWPSSHRPSMSRYQQAWPWPWWPLASRHSWTNVDEAIPQRIVLCNRLSTAMLPINQCLSARNTYMEDDKQRESWLDSMVTSIRETSKHLHHGRFSGSHTPMSCSLPSMQRWNDPEAKPNTEASSSFRTGQACEADPAFTAEPNWKSYKGWSLNFLRIKEAGCFLSCWLYGLWA